MRLRAGNFLAWRPARGVHGLGGSPRYPAVPGINKPNHAPPENAPAIACSIGRGLVLQPLAQQAFRCGVERCAHLALLFDGRLVLLNGLPQVVTHQNCQTRVRSFTVAFRVHAGHQFVA
jgi:hypothetical protein